MDAVLGLAMTPSSIGLVLVEGNDVDGFTMDHDAVEIMNSDDATAAVTGGQYEGGRFFPGRDWPTYDSNRGNYGQPATLAKLYEEHSADIGAALKSGRQPALHA